MTLLRDPSLNSRLAIAPPELPRTEIPRAVQSSVPKWDSLAMVNLLTLIEEVFAIQISDADLERMTSLG